MIGDGWDLNGTGDCLDLGDDLFESNNTGTISMWVELDTTNSFQWSCYASVSNVIRIYSIDYLLTMQNLSSGINDVVWSDAYGTTLHLIHVSSDGSDYHHYIDGVKEASIVFGGTNSGRWLNDLAAGTHSCYVGRYDASSELDGRVDEFRWSSDAKSADWITTEYNNQIDPGTFAVAGTPEDAN